MIGSCPARSDRSSNQLTQVHVFLGHLKSCQWTPESLYILELFTSSKIYKRNYRYRKREFHWEVREWAKTRGHTIRSEIVTCFQKKKEKIGLFLPLHAPFNYVSLFTTSFFKCLPRCSFSLKDTEVAAEMWFCQVPGPESHWE